MLSAAGSFPRTSPPGSDRFCHRIPILRSGIPHGIFFHRNFLSNKKTEPLLRQMTHLLLQRLLSISYIFLYSLNMPFPSKP